MEEEQPKPAPVPNPPNTTPSPTEDLLPPHPQPQSEPQPQPQSEPPPPPPSTAFPPPLPSHHSKKRKLVDNVSTQNSKYLKIRTIVKELRPHFIEVLRTPDFRDSKAAEEIRKQMSLLMDLYKEMMSEKGALEKCTKTSGVQPLPSESKAEQNPLEMHPEEKKGGQPQSDRKILVPPLGGKSSSKKSEDGGIQGSYVVGGSNFGWNFIMYPGSKPIYYGVTRESRKTTKSSCDQPQEVSKAVDG